MNDAKKTKKQLLDEIALLHRQVEVLGETANKHSRLAGLQLKNAEWYRALTDKALIGIYVYQDNKFHFANKEMARITGYSIDELLSMDTRDLVHPDDLPYVKERESERENGEAVPTRYTMRIARKSGGTATLLLQTKEIEYGGEAAYLGNCLDITETARIEGKLQESEERFKTLVANIPGATYRCACDSDWTMEYISSEIGDISGYPASDFINNKKRTYASIIHPDDTRMVEDVVLIGVKNKQPFTIDYRVIDADGNIHHVYERGQGVFDKQGKVNWLDGAIFDVTERKLAEEELRKYRDRLEELVEGRTVELKDEIAERKRSESALKQSEEKYRTLVDNTGAPVTYLNPDGSILLINTVGAKYLGGTPDDFIGKSIYKLLPDIADRTRERIRQVIDSKAGCYFEDLIELPSDSRWFNSDFQPVRGADDKVFAIQIVSIDVTDRKQAEEALQEQRNQIKTVFEATPDFLILMDSEFVYQLANPAFCQFIGKSEEELIGKTDFDVFPSDEADIYRQSDIEVMTSGKSEIIERQTTDADGIKKSLQVAKTPILDTAGKSTGILVSVRDITERRRAEEELQKYRDHLEELVAERTSELKKTNVDLETEITERKRAEEALRDLEIGYHDLYDNAPAPYLSVGTDGIIRRANEAATDFLGYSFDEILALKVSDLYAEESEAKAEALLGKLKSGEGWESEEMVYRRKDGQKVHGLLSVSPIKDEKGQVVESRSVIIDITERKRTEQALRASEERHRALLDKMNDGFGIQDEDGIITYVNDRFCDMFGYSREELIGHPTTEFMDEENGEILIEQTAKREKEKGEYYELSWKSKEGKEIHTFVSPAAILDPGGNFVGTSGVITDITNRKIAEEALRESENKHRVLFETMAQGAVYQDADGMIISANPAAESILGLTIDQMQGRTSLDRRWKTIHEDGSAFPGETHPAMVALESGKAVLNVIMGVYHPRDEEWRWINVNAVPEYKPGAAEPFRVYTTFTDITEAKRAKEALQESEERYRVLSEEALVGIYIYRDRRFLYVNPLIEIITRYTEDELLDMDPLDLMTDESREIYLEWEERLSKGEEASPEFSIDIRRKTGEVATLEIKTQPIQFEEAPAYIGSVIDVTAKKRLDVQRTERTKLLDTLRGAVTVEECLQMGVKAVRDAGLFKRAIFTTKGDHGETTHYGQVGLDPVVVEQMTKAPPATQEMYDYMFREEFKISNSFFIPVEADLDFDQTGRFIKQDEEMAEGPNPWCRGDELFITMLSSRGRVESYLSVDTPFNGQRPDEATVLYLEDITDIVARQIRDIEALEALKESEERYRSLQANIPVGVYRSTPQGEYLYANKAIVDMLGYESTEELYSVPVVDTYAIPEERERFIKFMEEEGVITDFESQLKRKDGISIWGSFNSRAVTDENGNIIYYDGIVNDITESKKQELRSVERAKLLDSLRAAVTVEECLQMGVETVHDAGLYERAVFTTKGEHGETTHYGQVGLDPRIVERISEAPPATQEMYDHMYREEFRISNSYFIPVEANVDYLQTGRYVKQEKVSGAGRDGWRQGDELFITMLGRSGKVESYLSVDTPFNGQRPDVATVLYLEDVVDIVARQIRDIETIEALRESEEKYRSMMDTMNDSVYICSSDFRVMFMNPAMIADIGYDAVGEPCFKVLHGLNENCPWCIMDRVLNGESMEYELTSPRNDRTYLISNSPIHHVDDTVSKLSVFTDITERKRTEKALRESEEKFRNLAEVAPNMIFIFGKDRILYVNEQTAEIIGYSRDEFYSSDFDFMRVIAPEYKKLIRENLAKHMQGQDIPPDECRLITKDGKKIEAILATKLILYEGTNCILGIATDVTKRKQVEEALLSSEERYRTLQANIPVGVFRTTPEGEFLSANEALAEMLGYKTLKSLIGIPVADVYAFPEGRREFIKQIEENGVVTDFETQLKRKDGAILWVSFNSRAVADENGDIILYDGIVEDITERKRAEEQIKSSLAEKEVLLKEIHHRVKNNMQVISSLLNLQDRYVADDDLHAVFRESQNRIKTMALIHESLYTSDDLARIDFAEYVETLVRRSFNTYGAAAENISLKSNIAEVYLDVSTSIPVALIINELVSNAIKHAFPDGKKGKLKVDFEKSKGNKYVLKISDNGVGLPKGFNPEEKESLGMGLINALVKQLGAEMNIDGRKGTSITITFTVDRGGTDG